MHGPPAPRPKLPRWRQALIELLLSVLLLGGIILWFPLIRVDAFWARFGGPSLFGLSLALALWHRHSTALASERLPVRCQATRFTEGSDKDPRWRLTFECPLPGAALATARTRLPEWQWLEGTPPPHSLRARLQRGGLGGWLLPLETVELEAAPRPQRK